jgi:hypothetical protein
MKLEFMVRLFNKITMTLMLAFIMSSPYAHVHHPANDHRRTDPQQSPVDIVTETQNTCGGQNRQGFGHIGPEPHSAKESLRRQCLDETAQTGGTNCTFEQMMSLSPDNTNFLINSLDGTVRNYLEEYFKDFLATELNNLGESVPDSLARCINTPERRNDLHATELQSSHEFDNILSAVVLNEIYNFNLESGQRSFEPYMDRLGHSFPILYFSRSSIMEMMTGHRGIPLRKVLREELGEDFNVRTYDGREHHRIMNLIQNARKDPSFEARMMASHQAIKDDYAEEIKRRMQSVCTLGISPFNLQFWYPQVFNQAILDMNEDERAAANFFLCRRAWYYQDNIIDTDCDGIMDDSDPEPSNPFSPLAYQVYQGEATHNPPYRNSYDYNVLNVDGQLRIQTSLSVTFNGMTEEEETNFRNTLSNCSSELSQHMSEVFNSMKSDIDHYRDLDLNVQIDFTFPDKGGADFNIHRCYCTDCYDVPDPDNPGAFIPKSTCREDLSPAQQQSVITTLGSLDLWRNRADAANMMPSTSCHTIKHEILHRFGLPDEYTDTRIYPYNQTDCNIMGDASALPEDQGLRPRQLQEIINPRFNRDGCW